MGLETRKRGGERNATTVVLSFIVVGLVGYIAFQSGAATTIKQAYQNYPLSTALGQKTTLSIGADPTLINKGNPPSLDCEPMHPKVIVYNRIPKAGSSTMQVLIKALSKKHGFKVIVPEPKHDPEAAREAIWKALKSPGRSIIVEHFNFPDILSPELAYINVFRDPVGRCVSAYYYLRLGPRDEKSKLAAIKRYGNMTINECMELPYEKLKKCFNCPSTGQARFVCGMEHGMCDKLPGHEILDRAWYNMESQYFIGITEEFRKTAEVLEALYPEFFVGMGEILDATPPARVNSAPYELPTEESKQKMMEWAPVDQELYKRSKQKLDILYNACMKRQGKEVAV